MKFLISGFAIYVFFKLLRGILIHDKIILQSELHNLEPLGLREEYLLDWLFFMFFKKKAALIFDIYVAAGALTWSVCQVVMSSVADIQWKERCAKMHEFSIAFSILQSIAFYVSLYK